MQVVRSRTTYSRFKKNRNNKSIGNKPASKPANLRNKRRDQENRLRDLVEHRFLKMDENHNRIRDQFLGDLSHRYD